MTGVVVDTEGRPVAGARLSNGSLNGGAGCETGPIGAFAFSFPLSARSLNAEVSAAGYNTRGLGWPLGLASVVLRVVMQHEIVAAPGSQLGLSLAEADLPYYVGEDYESDYCSPCKLIALAGTPTLARVQWTGDDALQVWASNGGDVRPSRLDGERSRSVEVKGASRLYVGLPLGADRRPQRLSATTAFEVSVQ